MDKSKANIYFRIRYFSFGEQGAVKKVRPAVLKITDLHDLPSVSRSSRDFFHSPTYFRGLSESAKEKLKIFVSKYPVKLQIIPDYLYIDVILPHVSGNYYLIFYDFL